MTVKSLSTESMNVSEARRQWSQLLNRVHGARTRVLIEKSGIPVAAVVSPRDLERLKMLDEQWERDSRILEEFSAAFAHLTPEEIEREVARAITEGRAAARAERERQAVAQSA